jgi:hypothetical protein
LIVVDEAMIHRQFAELVKIYGFDAIIEEKTESKRL